MTDTSNDGWVLLSGAGYSEKWHYTRDGKTLCGREVSEDAERLGSGLAPAHATTICGGCKVVLARRQAARKNTATWKPGKHAKGREK